MVALGRGFVSVMFEVRFDEGEALFDGGFEGMWRLWLRREERWHEEVNGGFGG